MPLKELWTLKNITTKNPKHTSQPTIKNNKELFAEIIKTLDLKNDDKIGEILDTTKVNKIQKKSLKYTHFFYIWGTLNTWSHKMQE